MKEKSLREIIFRGKQLTNNEWIYGNLIITKDNKYFITKERDSAETFCFGASCIEVNSETVGQFIGLKDKNGTRIFEGDIVKFECDLDGDGEISTELIEIYYDKTIASFLGHSNQQKELPVTLDYLDECEVVGNMYDNPELMENEE